MECERQDLPFALIECIESLLAKPVDARPAQAEQIQAKLQVAMKQMEQGMIGSPPRRRNKILQGLAVVFIPLMFCLGINYYMVQIRALQTQAIPVYERRSLRQKLLRPLRIQSPFRPPWS